MSDRVILLPDWYLESHGDDLLVVVAGRARLTSPSTLRSDDVSDITAMVSGVDDELFSTVIRRAPRLEWVHVLSAGLDRYPLEEFRARDIILTNGAGTWAPAMAEYALGAMIMLARSLPSYVSLQTEMRWERDTFAATLLRGKTLGIVGYGATGRHLAALCTALEMDIWATRRTERSTSDHLARVLPAAELGSMLRRSEFVVLCASLNSSSRVMIGEPELQLMNTNTILINVARGELVDESALVRALEGRWIRAAMTDVACAEPLDATSRLWNVPNLWITPHISGSTPETRDLSTSLFHSNLGHFLDGKRDEMSNRVDIAAHI